MTIPRMNVFKRLRWAMLRMSVAETTRLQRAGERNRDRLGALVAVRLDQLEPFGLRAPNEEEELAALERRLMREVNRLEALRRQARALVADLEGTQAI